MDDNKTFADSLRREADQYDEIALDLAGLSIFIASEPHSPRGDEGEAEYMAAICAILADDALNLSRDLRYTSTSQHFTAGT